MEVRREISTPLYRWPFFLAAAAQVPAASRIIDDYGTVNLADYSARRNEIDTAAYGQVRTTVQAWFVETQGKTPVQIVDDWIASTKPFCFQGGLGHRFSYEVVRTDRRCFENISPHHWCIRPEHYARVMAERPPFLELAGLTNGDTWSISAQAAVERWGN